MTAVRSCPSGGGDAGRRALPTLPGDRSCLRSAHMAPTLPLSIWFSVSLQVAPPEHLLPPVTAGFSLPPALLPVLRPGPSSHLCHSQGAFPARGHTESSPRVQTHAPHFTRGPSTYVSFTKLSERPAWEASLSARQLGSRPEIVPGTSNHPH